MASLAIIIVNFRTPGLVIDCLSSLAAEVAQIGDCRVVVADNFSGDDSVQQLEDAIASEGWGGWASVLPVPDNRGFAAGNNAAIRMLHESVRPPDYYCLLNPDTIVHPGAMRALLDFMTNHPAVGIAGSRLEHPDSTPQRSAFRFPGILSEFEAGARTGPITRLLHRWMVAPPVREDAHRTDWVSGACLCVRRSVLDAVGWMDERFFLYFEETDLCRRAARSGWPCWHVPASRVIHLEGQSTGFSGSRSRSRRMPPHWFQSRQYYYQKHHGRLYCWAAGLAWISGHLIWKLRTLIQRKPDDTPERYLSDLIGHSVGLSRAAQSR